MQDEDWRFWNGPSSDSSLALWIFLSFIFDVVDESKSISITFDFCIENFLSVCHQLKQRHKSTNEESDCGALESQKIWGQRIHFLREEGRVGYTWVGLKKNFCS